MVTCGREVRTSLLSLMTALCLLLLLLLWTDRSRRHVKVERLSVAYPLGPSSLAPWSLNEEFSVSILGNVYETLTETDGDLALRPGLAESWYNPDDLTWVFRLREGVRLHDGRLLRASDVAACVERARSDPSSQQREHLTAVRSLEAPDDRTLLIRTAHPFGALSSHLSNVFIGIDATREGDPPLGTGPYRIASWSPGGTTVLEAFSLHRNGPPAVRTLEFRAVSAAHDRVRLLREGRVQLIVDVPPGDLDEIARLPQLRTFRRSGLRVLFLAMDCRKGGDGRRTPFRDTRVRRAVALAIDRQALVRGPLAGFGDVASQIVAPGIFGHDDRLPPIPFDPRGACRLLAEAGYRDGFSTDLNYVPGKYRGVEEIVESVAADLARVGIHVSLRPWPQPGFIARVRGADMPFYLSGALPFSGDAGLLYAYLLHSRASAFGSMNGGFYSDPVVDDLLRRSASQLEREQRWALLNQVAWRVREDVPIVPLVIPADLYAVSRDLDFQPRLDRRIRGADLGPAAAPGAWLSGVLHLGAAPLFQSDPRTALSRADPPFPLYERGKKHESTDPWE